MQENIIISASDEELARQYMLHLLREIQDFSRSVDQGSDDNEVPIWIPYGNILGEVLRSEKGTDNRVTKRLFAFIKIIAISKGEITAEIDLCSRRICNCKSRRSHRGTVYNTEHKWYPSLQIKILQRNVS